VSYPWSDPVSTMTTLSNRTVLLHCTNGKGEAMANVKLHINVSQGIIDAEGDQEFVWRVYEDFRDRLGAAPASFPGPAVSEGQPSAEAESVSLPATSTESKGKKRPAKRRQPSAVASSTSIKDKPLGITGYRPRILTDLDTSGLKEFIGGYTLANNRDIIVVLTRFLETKGVKPASLDAYFTCYRDAAFRIPEKFGQAFADARSKKGFIEFTGPDDIALTIRGTNHIDHGGIKKIDA
jgi:hypothetical protein